MKTKLLYTILLSIIILTGCNKSEKIDVANLMVKSDLDFLVHNISGSIIERKNIKEMEFDTKNKAYGQTYQIGINEAKSFEVMGFVCNGIGEGTKVVKILGNYYPRTVTKIELIDTPEGKKMYDDRVFIDKKDYGEIMKGDMTNLGLVIHSDYYNGEISIIEKISEKDIGKYNNVKQNPEFGYYINKKVDRSIKYISLLSDTPKGLILDDNGNPYTNNQVIGDCTDKEIDFLNK